MSKCAKVIEFKKMEKRRRQQNIISDKKFMNTCFEIQGTFSAYNFLFFCLSMLKHDISDNRFDSRNAKRVMI